MLMYKYETKAGTASAEVLVKILTSTTEEPKHIVAVNYIETTATENHDAILRGYIEQERILDIPLENLLLEHDSSNRLAGDQWIEIDADLPVGQTLSLGFLSGSTLSNFHIVVKYTVT